jgi:TPR repeat protein
VGGDPVAQFGLGLCLAEGIGVEQNDQAALDWFRRAAETLPAAQCWCGKMLAEGRGCDPDPDAAQAWLLRASEHGVAEARAG